MNKYEDIINLPHYEPIYHSRMSIDKRAGQFAPFAALTGYDEEIEETARLTTRKHILDEESVTPSFEENIDSSKTITISRKGTEKVQSTSEETTSEVIESNEILDSNDGVIVEKIVKETVEIPFETITK